MIYLKELKLNVGYLHNLKNCEFALLITRIVELGEQFKFNEPMISAQYKLLQQDRKVLTELHTAPLKHHLSDDINNAFAHMRGLMIGLKSTIKALQNLPDGELKEKTSILNHWIRPVEQNMSSQGVSRCFQAASHIQSVYERAEKIRDEVERIGLTFIYEQIVHYRAEMISMRLKRNSDQAALQMKRKQIRKRVMFNLEMFVNSLQGIVFVNGEESSRYYNLCLDIERLMVDATAIQKSRATRSKNRREQEVQEILQEEAAQNREEQQDVQESVTQSVLLPVPLSHVNEVLSRLSVIKAGDRVDNSDSFLDAFDQLE